MFGNIFGKKPHFPKPKWPRGNIVLNLSTESAYRTQRENRLKPHSSCNVTSMAMALDVTGWSRMIDTGGRSLPDYLTEFFETPKAYDMMKVLAPWAVGQYPPQQVHAVLEWGINFLIGQKAIQFSTTWSIDKINTALDSGMPCVISGDFPYYDNRGNETTIGHIVTLVGYIKDNENKIISYIIDDPYGDYHTRYQSHEGNDIAMSVEDFNNIIRGNSGLYWGHIFKKKHPLGAV